MKSRMILSILVLSSLSVISCGGGGGGGSDPVPTTPTVPANASEITAANAEDIVLTVITTTDSLIGSLRPEASVDISLSGALDLVKSMIRNKSGGSGINLVTGVQYNESDTCPGGGTYSYVGDETTVGTTTTDTGTANLVNCDIGGGIVMHGSMSFDSSADSSTGDYSDYSAGSLDMTIPTTPGESVSASFSDFEYEETGNDFDGTYTISKYAFAMTIDVSDQPTASMGFAIALNASIVESTGTGCAESGHFTVYGGNSTTAEAIYNTNNTITIKANGVDIPTSPVLCT